jgi:hypothetical protein
MPAMAERRLDLSLVFQNLHVGRDRLISSDARRAAKEALHV